MLRSSRFFIGISLMGLGANKCADGYLLSRCAFQRRAE